MSRYFLPQRQELTQEEREKLTDEQIALLNQNLSLSDKFFRKRFGIDLSDPNATAERQGRTPRVFLLKDGKVSTLQENNIKPGSREFWECAMKGQVFGYPLGEKDPVQLQAWIGVEGLTYEQGKPLKPDEELPFPKKPQPPQEIKGPKEPKNPNPDPVAEPGQEPPRPSVFTRIAAFFGRKASKEKITRHREWTQNNTAYQDYQEKLQEYLADKDDLDEEYANAMSKFYSLKAAIPSQESAVVARKEAYEVDSKVWETENEHKDQLTQEAKNSAQIIADTFGAARTEEVLQAEKDEAKTMDDKIQALSEYREGEASYLNGMSLFGPKPHIKEDWIRDGSYSAKAFSALSEVKLDGMTVGTEEPRQITDEEFAALALFANLTPENGLKWAKTSTPPMIDEEETMKAFEELGYTREEVSNLIINQACGVMVLDSLQPEHPRNPMGLSLTEFLEPARQRTMKALQDYKNGDKRALAEIISRGMEFTDQAARQGENFSVPTQSLTRMADHLADLMERDPELKAMAKENYEKRENDLHERHKNFAEARSMDDICNNLKNYKNLRELQKKSSEAQEKLILAGEGKLNLSDAEKKDCLRAVLRNKAIRTSYLDQLSRTNKAALKCIDEEKQHVQDKYANDPKMNSLPKTYDLYMVMHCVKKAPEGEPAVLDMVGSEKWLKDIDNAVEKTIDYGMRTSGNNLDLLCSKVRSGNRNTGDPEYQNTNFQKTMAKAIGVIPSQDQPEQGKAPVLNQPVRNSDQKGKEEPKEELKEEFKEEAKGPEL